ncbi:MAG TPA: hypothetical protein VGC90_00330 [Candidatus Limnocylindrales bacterium]
MKVTHDQFQATDLSPAPGATGGAPRSRAAAASARRTEDRAEPRRVGIVFVHGIGNQQPGETFLDWSAAIVRMLSAWRAEQGFGVDPVVRSQFAFNPGSLPFLELAIPAFGDREAARWIVTEALWAEAIRPPRLDVVAAYLRDRLWTIVSGIQSGYRMREPKWIERKIATAGAARLIDEPWIQERLSELDRRGWGWVQAVDRLQRSFLTQWLVVLPIVAIGTLFLAIWAPLRRIPIGPLRDLAAAQLVDSFLTDWFGDLPVLLGDPVQAANVRARIAEPIRALTEQGCDSIVVVSHSGGAIVSFETLLDRAYLDNAEHGIVVDKLITHGEGLKLGWRLENAYRRNLARGDRLSGDIGVARPDLRWVDVWASFDPAPAGPLDPPPGVEFDVATTGEPGSTARESASGRLRVESRPVTNLMSLRGDHGAYWDNDEGYLVPLLRHIDDPRGWGDRSRFYAMRQLRTVRIERRRQRVAVLAAWRWVVTLSAIAAILLGGLASGAPRIAGDTLVAIWSRVPGGDIVGAPVGAIWGAIGTVLAAVGATGMATSLPAVGMVILGAATIAALFAALGQIGNWAWARWDAQERAAARLEHLPALDRTFAASAAITLVAAIVGLLGATLLAGRGGAMAVILVFALVGGAVASGAVASRRTERVKARPHRARDDEDAASSAAPAATASSPSAAESPPARAESAPPGPPAAAPIADPTVPPRAAPPVTAEPPRGVRAVAPAGTAPARATPAPARAPAPAAASSAASPPSARTARKTAPPAAAPHPGSKPRDVRPRTGRGATRPNEEPNL